jgi:hypothetical protein
LRKLVIILIALAALTTFIRAIDTSGNKSTEIQAGFSETSSDFVLNE